MQSFEWSTCISKCKCSHLDGQLLYPNVNVVIWIVNLYIQMDNAVRMVPMFLFQGYPERKMYTCGFFSHDHDVIKIGPEFLEQKGNVLLFTDFAFNAHCV